MGLLRGVIRSVLDEVKPKAPKDATGPPPQQFQSSAEPYPTYSPPGAPPAYLPAGGAGAPPPGGYAPPPADRHEERRQRRGEKGDKEGKYKVAYQVLTDGEKRRTRSLYLVHMLAYSLIIVGAIFLGLCASGNYPTTVENQKWLGIFADNIAKYSLYVFSGLVGVVGVLLTRSALRSGGGLGLGTSVLVLALLSVCATIGLSIYILTINTGMAWWGWLLAALMLFQRLLYLVALVFALWTLREVSTDAELRDRVAQVV